jgi:hypothetical protein
MFTKTLTMVLLLACFAVAPLQAQDSYVQTALQMRNAVEKAVAKNKPVVVVLKEKAHGTRKIRGLASNVSKQGFDVANEKSGATQSLTYQEIKEVRGKGWPTAAKIGIAGGVATAVVLGVLAGAIDD